MALEPKKKKREREREREKRRVGVKKAEKLLTISNSSWNKTITIAGL